MMGEHKNDLSYEELVRKREREDVERERMNELQDRREAEELAKLEAQDVLSLAGELTVRRAQESTTTSQPLKSAWSV